MITSAYQALPFTAYSKLVTPHATKLCLLASFAMEHVPTVVLLALAGYVRFIRTCVDMDQASFSQIDFNYIVGLVLINPYAE